MSSDLYEQLGITRDATPEQVKKAYKRLALQTHPDRLPQDATQAQREHAAEEFRKINNAYEILSDREKRMVYDREGVWPPPTRTTAPAPEPSTSRRNHRTSYNSAHMAPDFAFEMGPAGVFFGPGFTDPFRIFEEVFGSRTFSGPMLDQQHGMVHPLNNMLFGGGSGVPFNFGAPMRVTSSSTSFTRGGGFGGRGWVSESHSSRTVNGRTETVHKRVDAQGNEYVTYTDAHGGTRHTVNGTPQDGPSSRNAATTNGGYHTMTAQQSSSRTQFTPAYAPPPGPPPPPRQPPPSSRYHAAPSPSAPPPPRYRTRPNPPRDERAMREEHAMNYHANQDPFWEASPFNMPDNSGRQRRDHNPRGFLDRLVRRH